MAGNTEYKNKWQTENYDRINLTVKKGKKAVIKEFAELKGESINSFLNRLINEAMGIEENTSIKKQ